MDKSSLIYIIRQEIINHQLNIKAVIQDINNCLGPLEILNELNESGREKIALLRKQIRQMDDLAHETVDPDEKKQILDEISSHREQLTSILTAFKTANMKCMLNIDRINKNELFDGVTVKKRQRKDKEELVKMSSDISEKLMSISRNLAETTQRSALTLDNLVNSSNSVSSTQQELHTTGGVISQSGKLLAKYGRRELTDKILVFLAFTFFLICVIYIIFKRLF